MTVTKTFRVSYFEMGRFFIPSKEVISVEILQVDHIQQKYQAENGEITAIQDISFTMQKGEFLSIVGPSGCGKSTLLSMIAGLLPPSRGSIRVKGEEIHGVSSHIGYMLQKDNLLEWRTIKKNVQLGLEVRHMLTPEAITRTQRLLETYGLAEFQEKYPSQLSGGMRQRAALIRTLAINPDILLLDEAFSALDFQTRLSVTEDVYHILKQEQITTIMVTHDIPEGISMGDRILILSSRPAVIREMLPLEFDLPQRTPLACRNHPNFSRYFHHIWKEMNAT